MENEFPEDIKTGRRSTDPERTGSQRFPPLVILDGILYLIDRLDRKEIDKALRIIRSELVNAVDALKVEDPLKRRAVLVVMMIQESTRVTRRTDREGNEVLGVLYPNPELYKMAIEMAHTIPDARIK